MAIACAVLAAQDLKANGAIAPPDDHMKVKMDFPGQSLSCHIGSEDAISSQWPPAAEKSFCNLNGISDA
jgi:hypothetical protein